MGLFLYTGELFGQASTAFVAKPLQFVGRHAKSSFITEIGDSVEQTGEAAWRNMGRAAEGVKETITGTFTGNRNQYHQGVGTVKSAITSMGDGLEGSVKAMAGNVKNVAEGIREQDFQKIKMGGREILKVAVVGGVTIGIVDVLGQSSLLVANAEEMETNVDNNNILSAADSETVFMYEDDPEKISTGNHEYHIETINHGLEAELHAETAVPYMESLVELPNGDVLTGVFPDFNELTVVSLPESLYMDSDYVQFEAANTVLTQQIESFPDLFSHFTPDQIEQIRLGETPDGYVWHHHEVPGRLELVDETIHAQSGHTGGRLIWGGGTEYR